MAASENSNQEFKASYTTLFEITLNVSVHMSNLVAIISRIKTQTIYQYN